MIISLQDATPLLTGVGEGRLWNCIKRRPSHHHKMKKIFPVRSGSSWRWSRPRSKDPSREVDWMEGATSSCTSSTAATTIPCWEMEAADAHRDVVGRKGKAMGEERSSSQSSRVRWDQAQKNGDCVGVLPMSKTTLECWHAAALPRVERTA